jgi:hypothetical protein
MAAESEIPAAKRTTVSAILGREKLTAFRGASFASRNFDAHDAPITKKRANTPAIGSTRNAAQLRVPMNMASFHLNGLESK